MRALRAAAVAGVLVLGTLVAPVALPAGPAQAIDQNRGYPGICKDGNGVTVVIDFQALGGETIVRCNPSPGRGTGLDALKGAGIQVAGVQRWGEAFICRIENRPSAIETVAVDNAPTYREPCINTPPAKAYWSYWHAGNNCAWSYSQWGVKNRDFTQGGFEGWSFSLNATETTNPQPRVAAVRPGTEGGACQTAVGPGPTTNDPNEKQPGSVGDTGYQPDPDYGKDGTTSDNPYDPDNPTPVETEQERTPRGSASARSQEGQAGSGAGSGQGDTSGGSQQGSAIPGGSGSDDGSTPQSSGTPSSTPSGTATSAALPLPLPRQTSTMPPPAPDPAGNVAFSGGQQLPDVDDVVRAEAGASDLAPWIAGGAILVLAGLGLWTARRRRARLEG